MPDTAHPSRFFALTLAWSVPFWVSGALWRPPLPFGLPISALMVVVPLLVAMYLGGTRVVARTLSPTGGPWLLVALGFMPAISAVAWGLRGDPAPSLRASSLLAAAALYGIGAIAEEVGWTGYAQRPLVDRLGALPAAMLIGAVWAAWHIVPYAAQGRTITWIVGQCAATVAMRVVMVWLVRRAHSALVAVVFHAMINVCYSAYPRDGSLYDPVLVSILTGIVAAALAITTRGRLGSQR